MGEFNGIADKVVENLLQAVLVGQHGRYIFRHLIYRNEVLIL